MISLKSDKILVRGQDLQLGLSHCGQCTSNGIIFPGSGSYTVNYTQMWTKQGMGNEREKYQLMILPFSFQELIQEQVEVSCCLLLKLTVIMQSLLHEPKAVSVLSLK